MRKMFVPLIVLVAASFIFKGSFAAVAEDISRKSDRGSKTDELPQWATMLPGETGIVFALEDVEALGKALFPPEASQKDSASVEGIIAKISELDPKSSRRLEAGAATVRTLLSALKGSLAVGFSGTRNSPTVFLVANLKPEVKNFREFLSGSVLPLLGPFGIEPVLGEEQGVNVFQTRKFKVYFAACDHVLFASTNLDALLRMKEGNLPAGSALAGQESFRKAASVVSPGGLFFFVDLKKAGSLLFGHPSVGTVKALSKLGFDAVQSLVFSAKVDGSSLNLNFAVTTAGKIVGVPAILLRPNTATHAARFVPPDYSVFLRLSVAGALEAYREWQATVRRLVDDESWEEYQDALSKVKKERGVGLDDLLSNLADEFALALNFPELPGIPPTLCFLAVKDETKALDAISRLLARAGVKPEVFKAINGATIYATSVVPGVFLSYTAKGAYLILGLSPSTVESALASSGSAKCLAEEPDFASATSAVPRENTFLAYADMRRVVDFIADTVSLFYSKLAGAGQDTAKGGPPKGIAPIVQKLHLESERLGSAVAYASAGKDCLSLHVEVPTKAMILLASIAEEQIARSFLSAMEGARRTACLNNLRQIAVACQMYAQEHQSRFPDKLSQLNPYVGPAPLDVFCCPATETTISRPEEIDSKSSYKLVGGFALKEVKRQSIKLVLYESLENHGDGANVAFADGHVMWVTPETYRGIMSREGL